MNNKVIVITGAAGLLRKTFSEAVVRAGGTAVLAEHNDAAGKSLESELNGIAIASIFSLSCPESRS